MGSLPELPSEKAVGHHECRKMASYKTIYTYVYIYIYIYINTHSYIYIYICIYTHTDTQTHTHTHTHVYICTPHKFTHTHTHTWWTLEREEQQRPLGLMKTRWLHWRQAACLLNEEFVVRDCEILRSNCTVLFSFIHRSFWYSLFTGHRLCFLMIYSSSGNRFGFLFAAISRGPAHSYSCC